MIHKKQITEIVKKITKHERGIGDTKLMHPSREWLTGVSIGLLLFIGSALWSAYTYTSNRDVSITATSEGTVEQSLYREAQVNEALKKIADREKEFLSGEESLVIPEDEVVATTTTAVEDSVIEFEEEPAVIPIEPTATTTDDLSIILN